MSLKDLSDNERRLSFVVRPITDVGDSFVRNVILEHEIGDVAGDSSSAVSSGSGVRCAGTEDRRR